MANQLTEIAAGCSAALGDTFDCFSNGQLYLFDMAGSSDHPCLDSANPFLSKNNGVRPIWSGCVQVETSVPARRTENKEGSREHQRRTVTLPTPAAVQVQTNWWAYIELDGDLIGGRVVEVSRDLQVFVKLVIDTSKPVPFSPTLVELRQWPRGVQV